jgi:chromosome segregation ATPase
VEFAQQLERLAAEQGRFTDWQRLAEVRWGRQLADWQGQMEDWRRQSEDGVREVQSVAKSVPTMKDELVELRRMIVEDRERATERATAIAELAAQRGVDREAIGQAEQRVASLAGRFDQLTAQLHLIADKIDRLFDGQQLLEGRIRAERERVESILIAIARLEERDSSLDRRLEELSKEIAALGRTQGNRADEIERNLGDLARRMDLRVSELERLEEEQKQREIAELELQIREMQERAKQAKG